MMITYYISLNYGIITVAVSAVNAMHHCRAPKCNDNVHALLISAPGNDTTG